MKKINLLIALMGGCLLMLNMESCSTKQGMVSCPDLHHFNHHQLAMHKQHRQNDNTVAVQQHTQNNETAAANRVPKDSPSGNIAPLGTASISNDVPILKHTKDIFKILTEDERHQVRDAVSNMLVKRPALKNIALKRFDRLDKKYPAPAESVLKQGGGALTTGEILAIVAIACAVTWALGIVGLIIGIIALIKLRDEGGAQWARILAIVAIVLGALDFVSFFLWLLLFRL